VNLKRKKEKKRISKRYYKMDSKENRGELQRKKKENKRKGRVPLTSQCLSVLGLCSLFSQNYFTLK
jgi:hypothetical protein